MHTRLPSLIGNSLDWTSTLPAYWRPDWPTMVTSGKQATPSFGKGSLQMNQGSMVSASLSRTRSSPSLNLHQQERRILVLHLLTSSGPANIISVYALTLCSNSEEKDQLYTQKNKGLKLYLLGYNCHGLSRNEGSRRRSVLSNSLYWEYWIGTTHNIR